MVSRTRRHPVSSDKRFKKTYNLGDRAPAERWQHSGYVFQAFDKSGIMALRATEEHILDVLELKSKLTHSQLRAAMKFKSDYQSAGIGPKVSGSYSSMPRCQTNVPIERIRTDSEEQAYLRWRAALNELGLSHRKAVISTVCFDETPRSCDIPVLQKGLETLAFWYKHQNKHALQKRTERQL